MNINLTEHNGLKLWLQTLSETVRSEGPDLTSRQWALLLRIYIKTPPHTVRGLAAALKVSKPVITRAVDRLSSLGYAKRTRDETDKRNVLIQRTVKGAVFLADFAETMEKANKKINRGDDTTSPAE
ncbi:MAG: MarR family transcriptional regulator [Emcibacter sp.]|nr:MarR family transcriptional regulator [Emcibacter sp.]HEC01415.1 MarR family transcriptional regulator [Sphingomonadales bacterium]